MLPVRLNDGSCWLGEEGLTLTKDRAEVGFRAEAASPLEAGESGSAALELLAAWPPRLRSEKTWTVPLSDDTASQSGCSPLEKARLYMQAGSAPRLSSCGPFRHSQHASGW